MDELGKAVESGGGKARPEWQFRESDGGPVAALAEVGHGDQGKAIAEASGGGFLGFGSRTNQAERDALAVLAACLGLEG